jgi:hypothetical protein
MDTAWQRSITSIIAATTQQLESNALARCLCRRLRASEAKVWLQHSITFVLMLRLLEHWTFCSLPRHGDRPFEVLQSEVRGEAKVSCFFAHMNPEKCEFFKKISGSFTPDRINGRIYQKK